MNPACYRPACRAASAPPALRKSRLSQPSLIMGAVAYAPKVVTIWEGFKAWFAQQGFAFDYVL